MDKLGGVQEWFNWPFSKSVREKSHGSSNLPPTATISMLKLYNTLTRKKEIFKPLKTDFVRQYDCGPTVYWYAHIGNMWRYVISDLLRRTLEYNGYQVKQVMNITDVGHLTEDDLAADTGEDKIEAAARKEKKTPEEIAQFYTDAFWLDLNRLNIQKPYLEPKATKHIPEMLVLIKKLEEKGFVYKAGNYICFDIAKFANYGNLSGKNLKELRAGARLEPVPGKKNPYDFALWIVDPTHLQKWDSPWGIGYPGWHIECSVMSMKYLGEQLDIHTGGEDNIFPHHENEIAQSEAATNKKFVNYWLHIRHNLVNGKKMSKSLRNVFTLQNLIDKGFDPLVYRYLCLTVHYRSKFNFTWEGLKAAQQGLDNLKGFFMRNKTINNGTMKQWNNKQLYNEFMEEFLAAINDDLNLPQALAVVWNLVKSELSKEEKVASLLKFDQVLGLDLAKSLEEKIEIPTEVQVLVGKREEERQKGNWSKADELREEIKKLGFVVEDTPRGPCIFRASLKN